MKRVFFSTLTVLILALAGANAALAQSIWISPAAAGQEMARGKVVLLDARSPKEYTSGHIDGALSAPWQMFSDMTGKPGDPRWGTLLSPEKLGAAIGALGISKSSRVLAYSSSPKGSGEDGRILWTLRSAGVPNVAIVDGGYEGWGAAGGKVSQVIVKGQPTEFAVSRIDGTLDVSKDQVKSMVGKARIIDSRSVEEYAGSQTHGEPRGGHLPGALSLPWDKVFDSNGRMRSANALKKIMTDAGLKPEDEIITYCTIGIRSAHLMTVLREIGYSKARNYSASFYEWSGDVSLPLEK